jgi:uncharacterized protein (DUF1501 family)
MDDTLIVISLRGGADALNMLVPYREPDYYRLRPTLAVPAPGARGGAVDLDGAFGLHPRLAPLLPLYERGELAFVHAVGWPGDSHSHFEAWEEIESGAPGEGRPSTGWLARFLRHRSEAPRTPVRAAAFGDTLPRLLAGALGVSAMRRLEDYVRPARSDRERRMRDALRVLYGDRSSPAGQSGSQTLDALDALERALAAGAAGESPYPKTDFGGQLRDVEMMMRAGVGLQAASVELGGWDTHFVQGAVEGSMPDLMAELAAGLAAFAERQRDLAGRTTVVVMSEFGRRVEENGSGGTDHGQGGMMMLWGGRVRGGRVCGEWPGLSASRLAGPGDVANTTDVRDVLGEVVAALAGERALGGIFPGYRRYKQLGLLVA